MKRFSSIVFILLIVLMAGCAQNDINKNTLSQDTKKVVTEKTLETKVNSSSETNKEATIKANDVPSQKMTSLTPKLSNKEALKIILKASDKFIDVYNRGEGIAGNKFVDTNPVEIENNSYIYLGTSLDTLEKLYAYLGDVFTEKTIKNTINTLGIRVYKNKLVVLDADTGSLLDWADTEILSVKEKGDSAIVSIKVPLMSDTVQSAEKLIPLKNIQGKGWLVDTNTPMELF